MVETRILDDCVTVEARAAVARRGATKESTARAVERLSAAPPRHLQKPPFPLSDPHAKNATTNWRKREREREREIWSPSRNDWWRRRHVHMSRCKEDNVVYKIVSESVRLL
ncbi:hypothetical protein BHE74_00015258 [Ensete ventricosum]|nr:hypothetical protein GW17_00029488 [Ensete ventricosum]RWW76638.1 hypothetical protein BHE74_00015258 [Ensete ventricosum]RZS01409.1 hypothetical protein BHM03_00031255 [Ensete ventricosum]